MLKPILLVEDNPHDLELTLIALAKSQLANEVVVVRDGAEALDYLARRGVPASLDDLDRHAAIMYGKADGTVSAWLVRHGSALVQRRGASERIVAGDAEAQAGLVLAGLGVAQMSTWLVGRHLREGSLVRILPQHAVAGLPIHVVWPKAKEDVPRVRELVGTLCAALEWDGLNAGWNAPTLSRRTGDIDA